MADAHNIPYAGETIHASDIENVLNSYVTTTTFDSSIEDVNAKMGPIDFRLTSTEKVMKALIDGVEQVPVESIALTLEPGVPTADSYGVRGQICIDSNYLYVCVSDNTWKKISLLNL